MTEVFCVRDICRGCPDAANAGCGLVSSSFLMSRAIFRQPKPKCRSGCVSTAVFQLLLFSDFAKHKYVSTAESLEWIPFIDGGALGGLCRKRGGFLGLQVNQGTQDSLQFPFPMERSALPVL